MDHDPLPLFTRHAAKPCMLGSKLEHMMMPHPAVELNSITGCIELCLRASSALLFLNGKLVLQRCMSFPQPTVPEVIKQEEYGREIDIWAVGVITYVCLSGSAAEQRLPKEFCRQRFRQDVSFVVCLLQSVCLASLCSRILLSGAFATQLPLPTPLCACYVCPLEISPPDIPHPFSTHQQEVSAYHTFVVALLSRGQCNPQAKPATAIENMPWNGFSGCPWFEVASWML